ncbi:Aste57867_16955 [Aphanomyces stellatus]|uniref:Aste57867_16955 protein n=1 Tax=Aphanomyces stellatus TaxID=120398 RepID=A0A485L7E8_9STRA|nr:hypothetical protein As57867_016897 [Aphanomyces stellatus]VFT93717.1 Aste57867_16955 [Aphanomyces stellatus]
MTECAITTLLNEVVATVLTDTALQATQNIGVVKCFKNMYLTTHTFRSGIAQWKLFHEDKNERWSLKMLKWWGGCLYVVEEEVLVYTLSPDRKHALRCPTTWLYNAHKQLSELVNPDASNQRYAMENVYKKYL